MYVCRYLQALVVPSQAPLVGLRCPYAESFKMRGLASADIGSRVRP